MKDSKKITGCCWVYRYEVLGVILLFIATILTIMTLNGIGIAAMFIVGMVLFGHKCWRGKECEVCYPDSSVEGKAKTGGKNKTTK